MKFSINRNKFIEQLNDVQLAISSRTAISILEGIKMEVNASELTLIGSNADISVEAFITVDEESELVIENIGGLVIQPARMLIDIVRKLPDQTVSLELLDNHQLSINSQTASFTINAVEVEQYPQLPKLDTSEKITIPVQLFKQIIRQTGFAVSNHESRPILTGVKFDLKDDGTFSAVATDSHRLAKRIIHLDYSGNQNHSFVIPGKSLTELDKILREDTENLDLYVTDNQVLFSIPQLNFYSRLLEGNYPETDQLIPKFSTTQLFVNASSLQAAVDRASLLSHAGKNNVIKLFINQDCVEIFGNYPGVGRIEEDVPFERIEGDAIEISFNPDYMKQALNSFGAVEVSIELLGSLRPFIIKPVDQADGFIQLITPIRTPE